MPRFVRSSSYDLMSKCVWAPVVILRWSVCDYIVTPTSFPVRCCLGVYFVEIGFVGRFSGPG